MKITVKVTPKSSKDEVVGTEGEYLKVKVRAVPERGGANKAVVRLLAKHFDVAQSQIVLVKGNSARVKVFEIG